MNVVFILGINGRCGTNFLYNLLLLHPQFKHNKLAGEDFLVAESSHLTNYAQAVLNRWTDNLTSEKKKQIQVRLLNSLGQGLLDCLTQGDEQNIYLAKTPSTECLDNFFDLFPDRQLILLLRNGKDTIESRVQSFRLDYQTEMKEYAQSGQRIVDFLDRFEQDKKEQILVVYYENLHLYTKLEVDRIFTFMGLNPDLVSQEQIDSLPIVGSSSNTGGKKQVHWQPIYDKSDFNPLSRSSGWSEELNQQFEDICGEVSRNLGYDAQTNLPNLQPTSIARKEEQSNNNIVASIATDNPQKESFSYLAKEITRDLARKFWFDLGKNSSTQYLYRRILESATKVKGDIIAPMMTYYNETRNDRWIVEYIFPNKHNGYFLEAGAANGKNASSCYILETQFDWRGICVEPHDDFFAQLVKNRPDSICENVCLAESEGDVTYIKGEAKTPNAYLSGIKSNLEQFKYQGEKTVEEGEKITKKAITLEQLLQKHNAPKVIDYAAFDIEGSELKVLEVFPFEEYTFLALSLECDGKIWNPITSLLKAHGYKEIKNPFNRNKPWERYWLHHSIYKTF